MTLNDIVLADPGGTSVGADGGVQTFWQTSAGNTLANFMGIAAVIFVIAGVAGAAKLVSNSKTGAAVKLLLGTAAIAVFLFDPYLITSIIHLMAKIVNMIIGSTGDVVDKSGKPATGQ